MELRDCALAKRDASLAKRDAVIRSLEFKNQKLTHELAYYRRIRFGAKTEAMSAEQLQLFEDDLTEEIAAVEAELSPSADSPPKPRRKAGRQPLPDHLPRETHIYKPDSYSGPIRQDRNQSNLSWSVRLSRNCMALPHSC